MPTPSPRPKKSEETRRRVVDAALTLFRKRGFDATTMRDVAAAAGLSLGAAYYYFRSKDEIVLAWYQRTQDEHAARARAAFAQSRGSLRARLSALMHTKLDVVAGERRLLGALLRVAADPEHPLSVFARTTSKLRAQSLALFDEALEGAELPDDLRALLGPALWMMHLGLLLQLAHDGSPKQHKTRALTDGALDLVNSLVDLARFRNSKPLRDRVAALVRTMGWTTRG